MSEITSFFSKFNSSKIYEFKFSEYGSYHSICTQNSFNSLITSEIFEFLKSGTFSLKVNHKIKIFAHFTFKFD